MKTTKQKHQMVQCTKCGLGLRILAKSEALAKGMKSSLQLFVMLESKVLIGLTLDSREGMPKSLEKAAIADDIKGENDMADSCGIHSFLSNSSLP
jgi:hypothetical protein